MTLYREATRDEIAIDDLGVASAVDVYTMDVVSVEPDAWGITSWRQLYDCMAVAENEGDWKECTDALGAALGWEDSTP